MITKEISISVDLEELEAQLERQREELGLPDEDVSARSTVFSLGKDPRVGIQQQNSVPQVQVVEILKDGLHNPYIEMHWVIPRRDIDVGKIVGFNVYRKKTSISSSMTPTRAYTRAGFDRISRNIPKKGRFSEEKKAVTNIRRSLIPRTVLNFNLNQEAGISAGKMQSFLPGTVWNRNNSGLNEPPSLSTQGQFENFLDSNKESKIGYVDFTKFLSQEKKKFVFSSDVNVAEISFTDKTVGYGQTFEYYVTSVTQDFQESSRSNSVVVTIEDLTPVDPPTALMAKQISENEIQLRICIDSNDSISKAIIYRRAENEIIYRRVASVDNVNDCIGLIDATVHYGKSYYYRVFLENIHGSVSQPSEIMVVSSVQKITPQSRSNNFRIPIVTAVQDQNSEFIKVTVSSNDPVVAYYVVERRDLTIHERAFSSPGVDTNYGAVGWETNKFFVNKTKNILGEEMNQSKDLLNRRVAGSEIVFIDNTTSVNHIYQYRVYGSDLFGNISPYSFSMVKSSGKKTLRTPVNVRSEILRGNPFRIKISWEDDNLATSYSNEELLQNTATRTNKLLYKVQRRKMGQTVYESFPLTANTYLIDEVSSLDALPLTPQKAEDSVQKSENISNTDKSVKILNKTVHRPFGLPDFLNENDIYYYRILCINDIKEESNFTSEMEVSTLPDLSVPLNLRAQIINSKVRPLICKISWDIVPTQARADYYVLERRFDSPYDNFEFLGRAYLDLNFLDKDIKLGNTYIYRVKAVDAIGRETRFFEVRITT
jgi:fibronectin type 3 domain-containing protein